MREGWNGELFYAPFKSNIPVILLHACFSTGWVENNEVSNSIETIYSFSNMFTSVGANYYATAWNGAEIVYDFLNGASNFQEANQINYEKITKETIYNGVPIWKNDHGYSAFVGDWSGKFPIASQTTPYNDVEAELWYNGNRVKNEVISSFLISNGPYYTNQPVSFIENSYDGTNSIISYFWDFGDGTEYQFNSSVNPSHTYQQSNTYQVTHTVTDTQNRNATSNRTISISNPPTTTVNTQTTTTVNTPTPPQPTVNTPLKTTYVYKWVKRGRKWYRIKVKVTKKVKIRKKAKRKKIVRKRR
jgi:PKD repeat protein